MNATRPELELVDAAAELELAGAGRRQQLVDAEQYVLLQRIRRLALCSRMSVDADRRRQLAELDRALADYHERFERAR